MILMSTKSSGKKHLDSLKSADRKDVGLDYKSETKCSCSNTIETAYNLMIATWRRGYICCPEAEIWYKFTPKNTAYYTIYSVAPFETIGYLYDSNKKQIRSGRNYGSSINFKIVHYLTANETYYLKVNTLGKNKGYFNIAIIDTVFVESVRIKDSVLVINKGESADLKAEIAPFYATNKKLKWESSNTNVATVNSFTGKITAVNIGNARITAKSQDGNEKFGCCDIIVNAPVNSVKINTYTRIIPVGTNTTITATVNPSNASNKLLYWTSSDTNIATIDSATGYVTAKAVGTAKIFVTAQDGTGKQDICVLTVIPFQDTETNDNSQNIFREEIPYLAYDTFEIHENNPSIKDNGNTDSSVLNNGSSYCYYWKQ